MKQDEERAMIEEALRALDHEQLKKAEACLWQRLRRRSPDSVDAMSTRLLRNEERTWRMKRRHLWAALRDLSRRGRLSTDTARKLARWAEEGTVHELKFATKAGRVHITTSLRFVHPDAAIAYALCVLSANPRQVVVCEECSKIKLADPHIVGRKSERWCSKKCRDRFSARDRRKRAKKQRRAVAKHK